MEPEICLRMWAFCARPCPPRRRGAFLSFRQRCRMVSSIASMLLVALRGQQNGTQALPTAQAQKGHVEFFSSFPPTWPTISPPLSRAQPLVAVLAPGSCWCLGIPEAAREAPPEPAGAAEGVQGQPAPRQEAVLRGSDPGPPLCESLSDAAGFGDGRIPNPSGPPPPPLTDLAPQAESHLPGVSLDLLPLGDQLPNVSLTFQAWHSLSVSWGPVGWWAGELAARLGRVDGDEVRGLNGKWIWG